MNYYSNSQQRERRSKLIFSFKFWIATLLLMLFYTTVIFAQNTIYIDPSNSGDPVKDGSVDHPFDTWQSVEVEENTIYLQKRGTSFTISNEIIIRNTNDVKIGAYGTGANPVIKNGGSLNQAIRIDQGSDRIVIDGIKFDGSTDYSSSFDRCIYVEGAVDGSGIWSESLTITNCEFAYHDNALIIQKAQTGLDTLLVENCIVHDMRQEGLWGAVSNPTIRNCYLYNINMDWHFEGHTHEESGGDAIQFGPGNGISGHCLIENNVIDKSETGNKFCFIYSSFGHDGTGFSVTVRNNIFYPPKDSSAAGHGEGGAAILIGDGDSVFVYRNKFIGRGYSSLAPSDVMGYITANHYADIYYNVFDSVSLLSFYSVDNPDRQFNLYNNTHIGAYDETLFKFFGKSGNQASANIYGNIFARHSGASLFYFQFTDVDSSNNIIVQGNSSTWDDYIGMNDWENQNFSITEGGAAHDNGYTYSGWNYDSDSILTPQGELRDIGACEYPEGEQINNAPSMEDQNFYLDENSTNSMIVGTVVASDPDVDQTLTYSIINGNTGNAFSIDSQTAEISVQNSEVLDFETNQVFNLQVKVQDNGAGSLSANASIIINLDDVNEQPIIDQQDFYIDENGETGDQIGFVYALDPDVGQALTYEIISGDESGNFQIDPSSGKLSIANSSAFNFEINPEFVISVEVTDNSSGFFSNEADISIHIIDINESPLIEDQNFSCDENLLNGTEIGTVIASDPDNGQSLTYSINAGNEDGTFQINAINGSLTIDDNSFLNFESNPSYEITISVIDDGSQSLANQANITVEINDVNEFPTIYNQSFAIEETISNGELIGSINASDPDNGQTLTYSITGGNDDGAFALDGMTGDLTVADNSVLDFDINPVYSLTIKVTDDGEGFLWDDASITVNLSSINQVPNISDQVFSIDENSGSGIEVGTILASDPDAGQTLTYSILSGNIANAFQIGSANGILTVGNSNALNFESTSSFDLTIQVQDNGEGNLTNQAIVNIDVNDVNEPPVINDQSYVLAENAENLDLIGNITAADPDNGQVISYSITGGNTDGAFAIDALTGDLTVADNTALDFDINPVYDLTIKVTDDGEGFLWDDASIVVSLSSINQVPNIEDQSFSIDENSSVGFEVGLIIASDPDAGQTLTYSILSGNINNAFQIGSGNGILTVGNASALNFESASSYVLTIQVQDDGEGNLINQAIMDIDINDINESPVIIDQSYALDENADNNDLVGVIAATDPDNGQILNYSITGGNTDGAFAIDVLTGDLTVADNTSLDFDITPVYNLTVKVTDDGEGFLWDDALITINLSSINQMPDISDQVFSIHENSASGIDVGSIIASDPDADQTLTYGILSGNINNAFQIGSANGLLTVGNSNALNYESTSSFELIVQVQDDGEGNLTNQASVTVNISDVNESPIIYDQNFAIEETVSNGELIGNVIATDPDNGQSLDYAITAGNVDGAFGIDAVTGSLTVADNSVLDFDINPVYYLTIKVTDNGEGLLWDDAQVSVYLSSINQVPNIDSQIFSVDENSSSNYEVGVIVANDPDDGQVLTYSILAGNTNNAFQVGSGSGILTVGNPAALNFETISFFELTVQVQDNGEGNLTNQATMNIYVNDVNESPVVNDQSYVLDENAANDELVGIVTATDPDAGQILSYTLIGGNDDGAFTIDEFSGELIVADNSVLDYAVNPTYDLNVMVTDDGNNKLSDEAVITVNLYGVVGQSNIGYLSLTGKIMPNPTINYFELELSNLIGNKLTIFIHGVEGELVIWEEFEIASTNLLKRINIEKLGSGVYFVSILNGDKILNDKLIVM